MFELESVELESGLAVIKAARDRWEPAVPVRNHAMALQRLDWRHRAKVIAEASGHWTPTLGAELTRLDAAIAETGPG